jgi:hypothetical protein
MLFGVRGAWRRAIVPGLVLSAGATPVRAGPAPYAASSADPSVGPERPAAIPNWSIRLSIAFGGAVVSDQERLLELEGYGGLRWNTSLGVARRLGDVVGVGGLVLYGWRSADAASNDQAGVTGRAPSYDETLFALGAQLPLSFSVGLERKAVFFITPWAGVGTARAEFQDGGSWQTGPAFGGGSGIFVPRFFFGVAVGAYFIPLPPPGDAGGHNDLGMFYLSLFLGSDVG